MSSPDLREFLRTEDGRQLLLLRELGDQLAITRRQRIEEHRETVGPVLLEQREDARQIVGVLDLSRLERELQCPRADLHRAKLGDGIADGRIPKNGDRRGLKSGLGEQLQPLRSADDNTITFDVIASVKNARRS